MFSNATRIVTMVYNGRILYFTCPPSTKYEDYVERILDRFRIPAEFKDFIKITDETGQIFRKDELQSFLDKCPTPDFQFHVHIDFTSLRKTLPKDTIRPMIEALVKNSESIKIDSMHGAPLSRQDCFIDRVPGTNIVQEPRPRSSSLRERDRNLNDESRPRQNKLFRTKSFIGEVPKTIRPTLVYNRPSYVPYAEGSPKNTGRKVRFNLPLKRESQLKAVVNPLSTMG